MSTAVIIDEATVPLSPTEQSTSLNEPLDGELDGELNRLASNAKLSLKNFSIGQMYSTQWKNMRSWGSFIDTNRMKLPTATMQWSKRFLKNLEYFRSNYFCVFLLLIIYCVLTSPFLLLAIAASAGASYLITLRHRESPIKIFNYTLSSTQLYATIAICSFPFVYLAGVGSAVFWVLGASLFIVGFHATLYAVDTLDQEPDSNVLFQSFPPMSTVVESV